MNKMPKTSFILVNVEWTEDALKSLPLVSGIRTVGYNSDESSNTDAMSVIVETLDGGKMTKKTKQLKITIVVDAMLDHIPDVGGLFVFELNNKEELALCTILEKGYEDSLL